MMEPLRPLKVVLARNLGKRSKGKKREVKPKTESHAHFYFFVLVKRNSDLLKKGIAYNFFRNE